MAAVESAIADLKAQFERVVAPLQESPARTESVRVERPATGQWLFRLHTRRSLECRFEPPQAFWLQNTRISARSPELCFAGVKYESEHLLVVCVQIKSSTPTAVSARVVDRPPSDVFSDPLRNVVAKRSWRALIRVLKEAAAESIEDVASQDSDLAVVVRVLEQPEIIETLSEDDPFAAARLSGVRERERLLSEEGGTWTTERVAKHLHLTRQAVNLRRKHGALLGLDAGRHGFRYPVWQFARTGTVDGLGQTLAALEHLDPWMRQAFIVNRNARLKEKRPIDVLRAGNISAVVKAASAFGEHGAA